MKQVYIINENHPQLLLFFAGWAADETPFKQYRPKDMDYMICYDYRTLENDHARVRLMSVPEVFNPYDHQYGLDNKKSLQNLLKDKKKIICNVESVVPNGNGIATVRFTKRLVDTYSNNEEARNSWRATIGYEYNPNYSMEEAQRLVNPFGFTVTSYRVDPIIEGAAP